MPTLADQMLLPQAGEALLMGNHALARALLEVGCQVATTYPGSPTPEIAQALDAVPAAARRYHFEYAVNEKVALELAFGAAVNGHLACVFFKSVGLNVAADSAVQLSLMNIPGGMIVVLGDDPGANSSQNEQDNRHFAAMAYLPVLEPGSPQAVHAAVHEAAALARRHHTAVILRVTTHVAHAKQVVRFGALPDAAPDWTPRFDAALGPYLPIAARVLPMKRRALERLEALRAEAEGSALNRVLQPCGPPPQAGPRRGLVASGLVARSLEENLAQAGVPLDLLELGFAQPLPRRRVLQFLREHDEVLLVEETDRVLEEAVKALAWDAQQAGDLAGCRLLARREPEELIGELGPARTQDLLARTWPDLFAPRRLAPALEPPPPRLPQLCPGCGHRSAFFAVRQALPPGAITVGDIGCHSLGFFPPYEMGEVLLCMGHSPGTGAGLALGNSERKVLAFLGDSTFYHAGMPGVLEAATQDHDLTLVLLDNGTTAMTGHQPNPGSKETPGRQPLPQVLTGLGVRFLREVDTYAQAKLAEALREAMDHVGFAVVIARHPCMLQFASGRRREGKALPPPVRIDPELCDQRATCVAEFGCPSFVREGEPGAPPSAVSVHPDLCIGDGSCLPTCPVHAIGRPRPEEPKR